MADKNFLTDIIDADLAEGKVQQIHTRFPPEPNGYLHIGSAKAIYINWSIANQYGGKFNLRLDDTNPAREGEEYVNSIIEDLHWLGADPNGGIFYGSDYFDKCYEYAEKLITEGKAYVDDLTREEMREYRGSDAGKPSRPSPWRDRSPEENLDLFRRMRAGEFKEGEKTLRAKIDLASPNMNMRDPAIYRIKYAEHHRQGNKWCIYPMYDFAHPIQDAIEGITHSMCSLEFENHRPLYNWVIENIFGAEFPKQREFARLNMTNTVMSKRYLRELVEMGIVDGWDDPRMPTLCGLRRRGYTPTSIFTFVREAGISKSDNLIDMRQLEACIRSELDLTAQRRIAVLEPVKLVVDNYPADKTEYFDVANNPNREANDTTTRKVAFTRELWIDAEDFAEVPPPKFKRLTVDGDAGGQRSGGGGQPAGQGAGADDSVYRGQSDDRLRVAAVPVRAQHDAFVFQGRSGDRTRGHGSADGGGVRAVLRRVHHCRGHDAGHGEHYDALCLQHRGHVGRAHCGHVYLHPAAGDGAGVRVGVHDRP